MLHYSLTKLSFFLLVLGIFFPFSSNLLAANNNFLPVPAWMGSKLPAPQFQNRDSGDGKEGNEYELAIQPSVAVPEYNTKPRMEFKPVLDSHSGTIAEAPAYCKNSKMDYRTEHFGSGSYGPESLNPEAKAIYDFEQGLRDHICGTTRLFACVVERESSEPGIVDRLVTQLTQVHATAMAYGKERADSPPNLALEPIGGVFKVLAFSSLRAYPCVDVPGTMPSLVWLHANKLPTYP